MVFLLLHADAIHVYKQENLLCDSNNIRKDKGLTFVAQMSNKGNIITDAYTNKVIKMGQNHRDSVLGFITQKHLEDDGFLYLTPGVSLKTGKDNDDQQYRTPEDALGRDKCDIIIVGRAIYNSEDPEKTAIELKTRGWASYSERHHSDI